MHYTVSTIYSDLFSCASCTHALDYCIIHVVGAGGRGSCPCCFPYISLIPRPLPMLQCVYWWSKIILSTERIRNHLRTHKKLTTLVYRLHKEGILCSKVLGLGFGLIHGRYAVCLPSSGDSGEGSGSTHCWPRQEEVPRTWRLNRWVMRLCSRFLASPEYDNIIVMFTVHVHVN